MDKTCRNIKINNNSDEEPMAFQRGDYICYVKNFHQEKKNIKWNDEGEEQLNEYFE